MEHGSLRGKAVRRRVVGLDIPGRTGTDRIQGQAGPRS